jgi:hypothetical protein
MIRSLIRKSHMEAAAGEALGEAPLDMPGRGI